MEEVKFSKEYIDQAVWNHVFKGGCRDKSKYAYYTEFNKIVEEIEVHMIYSMNKGGISIEHIALDELVKETLGAKK